MHTIYFFILGQNYASIFEEYFFRKSFLKIIIIMVIRGPGKKFDPINYLLPNDQLHIILKRNFEMGEHSSLLIIGKILL